MFRKLIEGIKKYVECNHTFANDGDARGCAFTVGVVKGYTDVIRSMGHKINRSTRNDNGSDRISDLKIDDVALVKDSKIDYDGYEELLKK